MRDLNRLPRNALGDWMRDKQPKIYTIPQASDQIAVLAVALPKFVVAVQRSSPDTSVAFDNMQGPPLRPGRRRQRVGRHEDRRAARRDPPLGDADRPDARSGRDGQGPAGSSALIAP